MPLPPVPNVAVVGPTGVVGRELLSILESRAVPHGMLRLLGSARSAGTTLPYCGTAVPVEPLEGSRYDDVDLVFLCAGGDVSRTEAPRALAAGAFVIDASSVFRLDPSAALVLPEVNPGDLPDPAGPAAIVASPNCTTTIALLALAPLERAARITRVIAASYQAASGGGAAMLGELEQQTRDWVEGRPPTTAATGRRLHFNVFSHDSAIDDEGRNEEERKLEAESRRILGRPDLAVAATCVRVPVPRAHTVALTIELDAPLDVDAARARLAAAPGVHVIDDRDANRFPEPADASGRDEILVGRLRRDPTVPHGLSLIACGDQLRKGAALNAVQVAEALLAGVGAPQPPATVTG